MKYSVFILLLVVSFSFSQTKNEKEERIKAADFPEISRNHFNNIQSKVNYFKFYRETDGDKLSFEVKFKYQRQHYSIEFDDHGKLEDIEVLTKKRNIPKPALNNILAYADKTYEKFRFVKIQKQYINVSEKTDKEFIELTINNPNNKYTHFEIIAEIKTKKGREFRELTFDRNGVFEKSRIVTQSSYEHALY